MRTMYDGVSPSSLPAGATMVAGYADGLYANLPTLRARYPHATVVSIAVTASYSGATVLDVERGDATPAQAPGWVTARRKAGADPTVYCNSSTWPSVKAAFKAAGVAEPHYWIAEYDGDPTIPAGAIAKQYRSTAGWDESAVADYWPGVDPKPTPEDDVTEQDKKDIAALVVKALLDADGWFPAPSDAKDYKTNRFWTLRSWLESALPAARSANETLTEVQTRLAAIEKKLGL